MQIRADNPFTNAKSRRIRAGAQAARERIARDAAAAWEQRIMDLAWSFRWKCITAEDLSPRERDDVCAWLVNHPFLKESHGA